MSLQHISRSTFALLIVLAACSPPIQPRVLPGDTPRGIPVAEINKECVEGLLRTRRSEFDYEYIPVVEKTSSFYHLAGVFLVSRRSDFKEEIGVTHQTVHGIVGNIARTGCYSRFGWNLIL